MSKNQLTILVAACALIAAPAVQAGDGSIGVYLDAAGTQCEGTVSPGTPVVGSIYANLAGATTTGITGAEFRIDPSNSSNYFFSFSEAPGCFLVGNPMLGGANLAFNSCQTGPRVQLGTLTILETTHTADATLTVRQRTEPTNVTFSCPLFTQCDSPAFTAVCLTPPNSDLFRATMNPSAGVNNTCLPVAVEQTSWSTIKAMYRN
jgi:hypothetical protein